MKQFYMRNLLVGLLLLLGFQLQAADYYWIGGGGNWSDLNHWRLGSSGGSIPSIVPSTGDNVFFDANSGFGTTTASKTVTLNGNGFCNNMTWANVPNSPQFITTNASFTMQVQGSLSLSPSTTYNMIFGFKGTSAATLTTNGTVLGEFGMEIDKPGSSLTVTDNLVVPATTNFTGTNAVTFTSGTFDVTGKNVTMYNFYSLNNNVRTLEMANANFTASLAYRLTGLNKTINAAGSTLNIGTFFTDGGTYNNVNTYCGAGPNTQGINNTTFSSITFTYVSSASYAALAANNTADVVIFRGQGGLGVNNKVGSVRFQMLGYLNGTGNVIGKIECLNNFQVNGNFTNTVDDMLLAPNYVTTFRGTFNINKSLSVPGAPCAAFTEINGDPAAGTVNFAAGAVVDINNVILTGVKATGPITPIAVNGVDGGSNVGFTITEPSGSGTSLYWVGGAGNWNDQNHWSITSGGSGGACIPFKNDNVFFDANSGLTGGGIVTTNSASFCRDMTWAPGVGTVTFNESAASFRVYGSVILQPSVTMNSALEFWGSDAATITTNGGGAGSLQFFIAKTGTGSVTLMDNWINNGTGSSINFYSGNLSLVGRTVAFWIFVSNSNNPRNLDISNATITANLRWIYLGNNKSITSTKSHITGNGLFQVNNPGSDYPRVDLTSVRVEPNNFSIIGTTFGQLTFTSPSTTSVARILNGNVIRKLEFKGAGVIGNTGNSIDSLILAGSKNYTFVGTNTINKYIKADAATCTGLTEMRGSPTGTLVFGNTALIDINNVYMQNMTATGTMTPIAINGADAGGNSGWTINSTAGAGRYWIGGAGDWNDASHWSTTSGGPGGACVPTVYDNVYFNAASGFTPVSKTVTINNGNAYCRNIDWTGATNAPIWSKAASWTIEAWGDKIILNPAATFNLPLTLKGNNASSLQGTVLGNFDVYIDKTGGSLTLLNDLNNNQMGFSLINGALNASGRTLNIQTIDNGAFNTVTSINISNSIITADMWQYAGPVANHTLDATNSSITAGTFNAEGFQYNTVNVSGLANNSATINTATINKLSFTDPSAVSAVGINGNNNTLGIVEYKGSGGIYGTANTINTLIFFPGKKYTVTAGTTTNITGNWFASGTPCNLTEIVSSSTSANATINKTGGAPEFDYLRVRRITAAGSTPFVGFSHTIDQGNNTNWSIAPYDGVSPILGLGANIAICATAFPYTLNTDGFFASPSSQYTWNNGSTANTFVATVPGTYSVTVTFPDGCSITDAITIAESAVTIAPITGAGPVCVGSTLPLQSVTAGGAWSTSDAAIATVNASTGLVTAIAPGTATITYTVSNASGCTGNQQATVTVNALPIVNAITGTLALFESGTTTLSNTTPGGTWSSSNTAVATVDGSGVVTGVSGGTADITYSVTNANGCTAASTATVTVDAFVVAKRELSILKTGDAQEPSTNGGFSISLPSGVLAVEDINIAYVIGGTATAASDYAALSGTAKIVAGQNSVALPLNIQDDALIENTETVIATLSTGTSTNYTYTIGGAASATVDITDDENVSTNRVLSVTAQLNASEPSNTGTFTVALPAGVLAPEDITVNYTIGGTATNGVDYESLSGTAIISAGQNNTVISVKAKDDLILEKTETIQLTLTGGTTVTAGSFTVSATQGTASLNQDDNDHSSLTRTLSVISNGDATESGANSSFTISLPAGYSCALPITVSYTITGTATNGLDYSGPSTTVILPAGQNNITVPVNVANDFLIEPTESVILDLKSGKGTDGVTTFIFSRSPTSGIATVNITDDENTGTNKTLSVTAQNGSEPSASGAFTISLPSGMLASEDITVNYTVGGSATAGTDFVVIPATATILAGQNSVQLPLNIIDDSTIESTETVTLSLTGGGSANLSYGASPTNGSASADIIDNDFDANSQVVLLTKVSDAIEGGTRGQYRISFPSGVTSSENVTVTFNLGGTASQVSGVDYTLLGLNTGNIVIPAGANEVFIDVDAQNDGIIEGPEDVILNVTGASSASHNYDIAPAYSSATVNIIDANASSSTALQVIAGTNGSEPGTGATFTVKFAGAATAALPVTVGFILSGTATSGTDYQLPGVITIPAGSNSVVVPLTVLDDKIIEPTETVIFSVLSGTAGNGSNAFIFPADPANKNITINISDNDAPINANRVLKVVKTTDAAEPGTQGGYTISLPAGYTSSANIALSYVMSGTAIRNTDYTVSTITLPAYQNSVIIPLLVTDDKIIENTETAILTLNAAAGTGNGFSYTRDGAAFAATANITDDDVNGTIKVVKVRDGAEGIVGTLRFNFLLADGMSSSEPITVNYTIGGTAVKGADYSGLNPTHFSGTAIISPSSPGGTAIAANIVDDPIVEGAETVIITITSASSTSFTFAVNPAEGTATADIADNDDLPANRVLSVERTTDPAETATNGLFTISLPGGKVAADDIIVNYTVSGTATAGSDYTAIGTSAVIPAGQSSVTVAVPVIDDQLIENTETVVLTIIDGEAVGLTFTASTTDGEATLNIQDNDNFASNLIVSVSATVNASEPGTNGSFRVSLPAGYTASEDITVAYTINGTAIAGSDYSVLSGTVVIPAGQTSISETVDVTDDSILESAETVVMTITGATSSNFTLLPSTTNATGTVLINDDESSNPANKVLTIAKGADGAEPGTNGSFQISLPAGITLAEDVNVTYTVTGSAAAGTDYVALTGTAVIQAGQRVVSIPVTVTNDQLIEQTENVTATLTGGSSASFSFTGTGNATVDITDDESTTSLALAISKTADGAEPGTNGNFKISLPTGIIATEDIMVNYTISGTATKGDDYTAITAAVTILAGQNSVAVPVNVADDQLIEATETVIMTLAGGSSASFSFTGTGSATVNIADDESITPANLALSIANSGDAAEPGTYGSFTISLPTGIKASEAITVNFTVAGSATPDADYVAFTGKAVIATGQNSVQLPIAVIDDQLIEGSETIVVSLNGGSSTNFTFTGTGNAMVQLADDDNAAANLVLNVTKTADAAEPSANGAFKIALPAGLSATEDITVNYTITGTAIGDQDYNQLSGLAVILAGDNSVDLPVTVTDDQIIENMETVTIGLSGGSSSHFTFTGTGSATLNIQDDDNNVPENLTLSILKTADGAEPGTKGSFMISLPVGVTVAEDITVNYTISGTATAGSDYTALSGTVTIPAEQNSVSIPVTVTNDQLIEQTENVTATLTGGSSASFSFTGTGNATVDIADDESTTGLALSIGKTADGAEPGTNGSFKISLPTGVLATEDITVNYTISGTATKGDDYTAITAAVTILAGQNSVAVPVNVADDQLIEATETVIMTLAGGSSTNFSFTGTGSATVNIVDDESIAPANLALSIVNSGDAAEPGTYGSFTISLPTGIKASEAITVNFTVAGSATPDADYVAFTGKAVIATGQNSVKIPVAVIDDQLIEGSETIVVSLNGGSSTNFTFTGTGNAMVQLADDDNAAANLVLNVTKTADAAEPSANGAFKIALPGGLSATEDITVNYSITGTAVGGQDYNRLSGLAVILAGDNSVDLPVIVTDDQIIENMETVIIGLSGGSSSHFTFTGTGSATLNIEDDDSDVPENLMLSILKTADGAETGTNGNFKISLPAGIIPGEDITVNYTIGGTATAGSDYTAQTGIALIKAGSNNVTVPINVLDDNLVEPTETVIMTLRSASSSGISLAIGTVNSATLNIADDDHTNLNLAVTATIPIAVEPATNGGFMISLASGKSTAEPVTVQYTISGTATSGTDYTALTGSVTIPAGASTVTVPVQVMDDSEVETPETVILRITGGQSAAYTYTVGSSSEAQVNITSDDNGDLMITKEIIQPVTGPYRLGQDITYRIKVKNLGTGRASGVVVTDALPLQLGLPARTSTGKGVVSVSAGAREVVWTIGEMLPGATEYMEVTCRITATGQMATSAVALSQTTDSDLGNNQAVWNVQIEGSDLTFPNVFTPNGDNRNETFVIKNLELHPENELTIVNRWGNTVFERKGYKNDWAGTGLNEGTYFYLLKVKGESDKWEIHKGYITLLRNK